MHMAIFFSPAFASWAWAAPTRPMAARAIIVGSTFLIGGSAWGWDSERSAIIATPLILDWTLPTPHPPRFHEVPRHRKLRRHRRPAAGCERVHHAQASAAHQGRA